MRKFYPYGWFQYGGAIMERYHPHLPAVPVLPVVTDPREFMRLYGDRSRGDLPGYFGLPTRYRSRFQAGGSTGMPAGVPSPQEMQMQATMQQLFPRQGAAGSPLLSGPGKQEAPKQRAKVDNDVQGKWVMQPEVRAQKMKELRQQQLRAQQLALQDQLVEAGVPEQTARTAAIQGEGQLAENVRERLNNYRQNMRLVTLHPDFDPEVPIKDQQYLNDDNSFRTTVLRGGNGLVRTNNWGVNFAGDLATGEGRAFSNITMDAENRYWKPIERKGWRGVPEAASNLGWDVLGLVGGAAVSQRVANKLASRGLPEASAALERQLVQSWRPPNVIRDNAIPGDTGEDEFLKKYLGPGEGKPPVADEDRLWDEMMGKATREEMKDAFKTRLPGFKDYVDQLFNDPEELQKFLKKLSPEVGQELLKDKLRTLPLDELKNYLKAHKPMFDAASPGGEPWNFGRITQKMRGPYASKEIAAEQQAKLRDLYEANMEKSDTRQMLLDVLSNPLTHQRRGGVVPEMPMVGWYQVGGSTGMPTGVPSPQEMQMQATMQQLFPRQAAAGSPLLSGTGKREVPKPAKPKVAQVDSAPEVEGVRQRVQDELIDLGIPQHTARGYAIAGEENMPENLQERLKNYRKDVHLASLHPDFDPTKPAKDQLALNDDHSFRTTVLRGQKGLTSTNNATQNLVAGALTGGGEGFANFVFDLKKRGWDPIANKGWAGVPEAVGNVGSDWMNMLTAGGGGFTNKAVNKLASRGLPEASLAMERQMLQSLRRPGVGSATAVAETVDDMADDVVEKVDDVYPDLRALIAKLKENAKSKGLVDSKRLDDIIRKTIGDTRRADVGKYLGGPKPKFDPSDVGGSAMYYLEPGDYQKMIESLKGSKILQDKERLWAGFDLLSNREPIDRKMLLNFLNSPLIKQRWGGRVPGMPMVGVRGMI